MASSLSNLVNNLAEGIHKIKSKYEPDHKKYETCGIRYKDCDFCLEYIKFKDDLIKHNGFCCNKNHQKIFDENFL